MNTSRYFSDNCLADHIEDSAEAKKVVLEMVKDVLNGDE